MNAAPEAKAYFAIAPNWEYIIEDSRLGAWFRIWNEQPVEFHRKHRGLTEQAMELLESKGWRVEKARQ